MAHKNDEMERVLFTLRWPCDHCDLDLWPYYNVCHS